MLLFTYPERHSRDLKSSFPDCWMEFPFTHGCAVSMRSDCLILLLTPLDTQIQFYFPTSCLLSKRASFCWLISVLSQINMLRGGMSLVAAPRLPSVIQGSSGSDAGAR